MAYARLEVHRDASPQQLAKNLDDQNPYVRLVALQALRAQSMQWTEPGERHDTIAAAVLQIATHEQPRKYSVAHGHSKQTVNVNISKPLQTTAAEALAACDVRSNEVSSLLTAIRRSTDEELIVQALQRWSPAGDDGYKSLTSKLKAITKDPRPAVAAAARAAFERTPPK